MKTTAKYLESKGWVRHLLYSLWCPSCRGRHSAAPDKCISFDSAHNRYTFHQAAKIQRERDNDKTT